MTSLLDLPLGRCLQYNQFTKYNQPLFIVVQGVLLCYYFITIQAKDLTVAQGIREIDSEFYERWEQAHLELAEVEKDLVILTDGLSSLEKKLMYQADEAFNAEYKKRLPETLQRREARRHDNYVQAIKAKAQAQGRKILIKGRIDMMKMVFDEWRTRSADRRNSI